MDEESLYKLIEDTLRRQHGTEVGCIKEAKALLPVVQAYANSLADQAHENGYHAGVSDFSNWFMDASIPAQRHQIGVDIAEDLHKSYDRYRYRTLPLIQTPPKNKDSLQSPVQAKSTDSGSKGSLLANSKDKGEKS